MNFKSLKGQKGHYDKSNIQHTILQLYESKFGDPTLLVINMNTSEPIKDRITENNSFRDQNVSHKDENWIPIKNGIEYLSAVFLGCKMWGSNFC